MSLITDIADAVVDGLNNPGEPGYSQDFTAKRFYQPVFTRAEMKDLHVSVVPNGMTIERLDRKACNYDCAIDIAVQKGFDTGDADELDPLMDLVDEIAGYFLAKGISGASLIKTEVKAIYSQEHMEQLRQFTSVLTLTFRVVR